MRHRHILGAIASFTRPCSFIRGRRQFFLSLVAANLNIKSFRFCIKFSVDGAKKIQNAIFITYLTSIPFHRSECLN